MPFVLRAYAEKAKLKYGPVVERMAMFSWEGTSTPA